MQRTCWACLADPGAVTRALGEWAQSYDRILVHVDVDVLDGAEFPIAENTRTGPGLPLAVLGEVLEGLCHLPNFAALTFSEVNPDHARDEERQMAGLIEVLAAAVRPPGTRRSAEPSLDT